MCEVKIHFHFQMLYIQSDYESPNSIKMKLSNQEWSYPTKQLNDGDITEEMQIKYLDLFLTNIGIEQNKMYRYLMRAF